MILILIIILSLNKKVKNLSWEFKIYQEIKNKFKNKNED